MASLLQLSLCVLLFLGSALGWSLRTAPLAEDTPLQEQWRSWKSRYSKTYADAHQETRARALWLRHWRLVLSHNSRSDVTFSLELNAFADKEPKQETRGQKSHTLRYTQEVTKDSQPTAPPASFDWRTKGVISPVKNQGQMGSANAFAVTEDLESLHALNTGQLVSLSVQELVDCCSARPGMLVPDIYECVARHGGLCSEADYPQHQPPSVCRNNSCQAVAKDAHVSKHVAAGNESAMLMAVLKCPLVVFVDAGHASFQMYKKGVYRDPQCGHTLDHALQLVGYGTEQGTPYWILKNSWGVEWGMEGYMLMERGVNMCGIADGALYPQ